MPKDSQLEKQIFSITGPDDFNDTALEIFHYQIKNNPVYRKFIRQLHPGADKPKTPADIPFMPIEFFKTQAVKSGDFDPETSFTSSGTTGINTSQHQIRSVSLYESSFMKAFDLFFGDVRQLIILALLPSYLERSGSSLVYMARRLIQESEQPESGFYLDNYKSLYHLLNTLKDQGRKVMLFGVTFALLDLAEKFPVDFPSLLIMETGGMKGRRQELTRKEVHQKLKTAFKVDAIHSEYGMTELLSQAYSKGEGLFYCPPWMKVLVRDINDPFSMMPYGKTGGVNVIDMANIYSCAFVATQDLGRLYADGSFEILGRYDHSDVRGCNLMVV